MENEFFVCQCLSDEHTLRFIYNPNDNELWTDVYLNQTRGLFGRIWYAIKYVFGYQCKYGAFDCFTFNLSDAPRMKELMEKIISIKKEKDDNFVGIN